MARDRLYDVAVIGGGPAGLSAALVLGRCRRRVGLIDSGCPRNASSEALHGFLTRDGVHPSQLRDIGRQEALGYGVELRSGLVTSVKRHVEGFVVELEPGDQLRCRRVLLATGVIDNLPKIANIEAYYGKSVHHCPYCDGWEHSDEPIAIYGSTSGAASLAIEMKVWSPDVVLCTDGPARIGASSRERLHRYGIKIFEGRIASLEGVPPRMSAIVFNDGSSVDRSALFFSTGNVQRSGLLAGLGCEMNRKGAVRVRKRQRSSVPGVFVCGDAAEDSQYAVIAAAHGARAAMAINEDLAQEDFP